MVDLGVAVEGQQQTRTNQAEVSININAVDTQTGVQFLLQPSTQQTIEGIISRALDTNSSLRASL